MKKQYEERLDELEGRLSGRASVNTENEKLRTAVVADVNASLERRLDQLQEQLRQETADRCLQLEKVRIRVNYRMLSSGH